MAVPSSQAAAGWVKAFLSDNEWMPLRDALNVAVTEKWHGQSAAEISEYVEDNLVHVAEHLRVEAAEAKQDGATCTFEIDNEQPPYIKGIARGTDLILEKLKKVCPFEFEKVCGEILTKIGGETHVTPKSGDGGIDFVSVGIDILPEAIDAPLHCRAAVIGQAKRYRHRPIAEKSLREFVGASLLKRNELRVTQSISPLTPVLLAYWTTANFEPGCKAFARKAGVWLMDGHTFSTYISRLGLTDMIMSLDDEPA